jgi:hypothetical protein
MSTSRPFGTDPTDPVAPWDAHVSDISDAVVNLDNSQLDISQVHTHLRTPPEYLWSLVPTTRLASPEPVLPPPDLRALQTVDIAEHLRAALRLHEEAEQLFAALQRCSAQANALALRWFGIMQTERRSPQQAAQYAQLEAHVVAIARQLATLRQRHSACLAQACEHEEAAGRTTVPPHAV